MAKNISQTTNNTITLEEFTKVVKWYEYSQNFKKVIRSDLKNSIEYEYYFVDCNWINNFKNTFHYERIKRKLECVKNKGNITLTEVQMQNLLDQFCKNKCSISENDRKKIQINPNNNIIKKTEIFNKKYTFNNFYINFVLLDKNIYEELKKSYVFGENIKYNVLIGSSLFIIKLNGTDIEIGEFESVYKYKSIYLLRFSDEDELAKEIKLIKSIKDGGIKKYISDYKINYENFIVEVIKKSNGKEIIIINLLKHLSNPTKVINNNINGQIQEEITITPKRYINFFKGKNSQLNSIIQLLTPIKELKDYLSQYKEFIEENKHIYILSSFILKIFEQLYGKSEDNKGDILKQLEIIINFLAQNIDIKPIDNHLHFILNTLHEELNLSPKRQTETINLISYESPLGQENETLETFKNYYLEYYQSIISNNINWIRKKYFLCGCNNKLCNFKSFPSLIFDLDATHDYTIKQLTEFKNIINQCSGNQNLLNKKMNEFMRDKLGVPIDITDCFKYYLAKETANNMACSFCNRKYKNKYSFHITPNYFIIILNRNPGINSIKIHLSEELNLENFLDNSNEHKKYQLIGLLINDKPNEEEKHFYSVIKNSNDWIQFKDEKITHINDKKKFFSSSECENNSRILLYKSMKY